MELGWVSDVALPSAAILVSTGVAIWIARFERKAAERARSAETLQNAAASCIDALTPFVSLDPFSEDLRPPTRYLRSRIVILQAIAPAEDVATVEQFSFLVERMVGLLATGHQGAMEELRGSPYDEAEMVFGKLMPARNETANLINLIARWMRTPEAVRLEVAALPKTDKS